MLKFRSFLSVCALALLAVFSVTPAMATTISYVAHSAVKVGGEYGAESAKFRAEQVQMTGFGESISASVRSDMRRDSNGYLMASADEHDDLIDGRPQLT